MNARLILPMWVSVLFFCLPLQATEFAHGDTPGRIGDLRQRLKQAVEPDNSLSLYMSAKAQAFLDLSFEETIEQDETGLAEDALLRASQLTGWLEAKQPEGVALPAVLRGTNRVREDLWIKLADLLRDSQGFPCAAPFLGRAEVQLLWSGHELPELGPLHERRYINEAEKLLNEAKTSAEECAHPTQGQTAEQAEAVQQAQAASAVAAAKQLAEAATALAIAALPDSVHFAYDKADISSETDKVLRNLADTLLAYPWLRLELDGHTDHFGNSEYNLKLSQRRAENVRQRLLQLGLPEYRFSTRALGKSQLLMLPDNIDKRSRDRRVQIIILNQTDPAASVRIETQRQDKDLQPGEQRRQR